MIDAIRELIFYKGKPFVLALIFLLILIAATIITITCEIIYYLEI